MELYVVKEEIYYDDMSAGGVDVLNTWFFKNKENAIQKVAELKPLVENYVTSKVSNTKIQKEGVTIDTPMEFCIKENDPMCYWGKRVYVTQIATED